MLVRHILDDQVRQPREHHAHQIVDLQHASGRQAITQCHHRLRDRPENRTVPIEAQFTALRYFALDGTDQASHKEQGSMIRRYIIWRNKHAADERLREVIEDG
ncbi:hypothetical protein AAH991_38960 [Microbispora sp. ZYX-F-249]|uniref:Transposase n=1 Tax=Microbispora maris TaxID=3144104 RepID=A0ABV0B0U7_9ACTN